MRKFSVGSRRPSRPIRSALGVKRAVVLAIGCLAMASAQALDFQFSYDDPTGTGFLDPVLGAQRRQALSAAADVWGRLILSSYADEKVTVHASFADYAAGSNTLAATSPIYYYSDFDSVGAPKFDDTNYPKALADHLAGRNLTTRDEITIKVNKAKSFNFGIGAPTATQYDFISVAAHEIGHGLGFTSSFRQNGDYGIYGDGSAAPIMLPEMLPKPYDQFLTLGAGGPSLLRLSGDQREAAMTSGNVFWSGSNGIAGNGGSAPQMYAPSPWEDGSSIGHANDGAAMMSPSISRGEVRRTPTAADRGMMRDMGWTLSVFSSEVAWSGSAGSRQVSVASNWMGGVAPLPGDSLAFGAAGAPYTDVDVDIALYSLGRIWFTASAPAYTLNFLSGTDTTFTGAGLVNESATPPKLNLATGSVMAFEEVAKAGNATFVLAGGETRTVPTQTSYYFDRSAGATIAFRMSSAAEHGNFNVGGGAGNGGIKAQLSFHGAATAGDAVIFNAAGRRGDGDLNSNGIPTLQFGFGGESRFEDGSDAGRAHITNEGILGSASQGTGGYTTFAGSSSAADATIVNLGGNGYAVGGVTEFVDTANAGRASFTNYSGQFVGAGRTSFFDHSSAGNASFLNIASAAGMNSALDPGWTVFRNSSDGGSATIINDYRGRTEFFDDASAANALIAVTPWGATGGVLAFHQRATAGAAVVRASIGSLVGIAPYGNQIVVEFGDQSSAGKAVFNADDGAMPFQLNFRNQSTAGAAWFQGGVVGQNRIEFYDASNAGSAHLNVAASGLIGFYDNTSAADATINIAGWLVLSGNASLGNATIRIAGNDATTNRVQTLTFDQSSTIANANITLLGGSAPNARGAEMVIRNYSRPVDDRAGNARITALAGQNGGQGGSVALQVELKAPGLALATEGNGRFRMEPLFKPGGVGALQLGSIEGSGLIQIDGGLNVEFSTGYLNTSTSFSGVISGSFKSLTKLGTGKLSLDGVNTYLALTSIDAGALAVNGSIKGDVVVNSGAALEGSGNVGGNVTVNDGGVLAPGNSPGTLRVGGLDLQPGSTLQMQFGASARDLVIVAGNASFAGTLSFESWGGWLPHAGDTITLFQVGGASQVSFSQVLFPDWAPGFQYRLEVSDSSLELVALNNAQPVPEPGSAGLMFLGLMAIGVWWRRPGRVEAAI